MGRSYNNVISFLSRFYVLTKVHYFSFLYIIFSPKRSVILTFFSRFSVNYVLPTVMVSMFVLEIAQSLSLIRYKLWQKQTWNEVPSYYDAKHTSLLFMWTMVIGLTAALRPPYQSALPHSPSLDLSTWLPFAHNCIFNPFELLFLDFFICCMA